MTAKDEKEFEELWDATVQAAHQVLSRPSENCPTWSQLNELAMYQLTESPQDEAKRLELKPIGLHKAFCLKCSERYMVLLSALSLLGKVPRLQWAKLKQTGEEYRDLRKDFGRWIEDQIGKSLRPRLSAATMGDKQESVVAQVLDANLEPADTCALQVVQGPELVAEDSRFQLSLEIPREYEGYTAHVALKVDKGALELTAANVQKSVARFDVDIGELDFQFLPRIPLDLLEITLQPRERG